VVGENSCLLQRGRCLGKAPLQLIGQARIKVSGENLGSISTVLRPCSIASSYRSDIAFEKFHNVMVLEGAWRFAEVPTVGVR
jgi:hypothetical protein